MLSAHIYKGGNPDTVTGMERIPELSLALGFVVLPAETADSLEDGQPVVPKIRECKCSLSPVTKRLKHVDATTDHLIRQSVKIIVIHLLYPFSFRILQ